MRRLALTVPTLLLVACAALPPATPPLPAAAPAAPAVEAVVVPNPNLVLQDIPPIPAALAQQVARYTDFRGHGFLEWHPTRREMLVTHRKAGGSTTQLFRVAAPMAESL